MGRDNPPFPPFPKRPAHSDSTRLRRGPHGSRPLPPPRRRRPLRLRRRGRLPPAAAGAPPLRIRVPCSARGRAEVSDSGPHANPVRSVRVCGGGAGLLRESRSGGACAFARVSRSCPLALLVTGRARSPAAATVPFCLFVRYRGNRAVELILFKLTGLFRFGTMEREFCLILYIRFR